MLQQLEPTVRYTDLDVRKTSGIHYTPSRLAQFVAQEVCRLLPEKKKWRILDPAIGDGELVVALLHELQKSQPSTMIELVGFDTDNEAIAEARARIEAQFDNVSIDLRTADFLDFAVQFYQQTLFKQVGFAPVDVVISNPPYVRTQVIGAEKAQALARTFQLSGRIDLSFAFLKGIEWALKPEGVAGVIVSNRFMTTKAGAKVREHLQNRFHIDHVWDLGDTKLFDAAVLPAVLLVKKRNEKRNQYQRPRFSTVYETDAPKSEAHTFTHLTDALSLSGVVETKNGHRYNIQHGHLTQTESSDDVWRIETDRSKAWLDMALAHTHCTFGDVGKVRVGVKTTADKLFIRDDWQIRSPLLRPVMTHHVGRRFRAMDVARPKQILYTHEYRDGKRQAVDLDDYPAAKSYLEANRAVLSARKYVTKAGRNWYEIWVPQDPKKWCLPKLVFRDIVERPTFWLDFSGAIVNGDCYWMALNDPHDETWLWLALAVANSTFIEQFYDYRFNNKLYAGRRRFITQYVKNFPLPDPQTAIARQIIEQCQKIYAGIEADMSEQEKEIDQLVWSAFGF